MKFLTICQYGHSRSVALCRVLHARGQTAVANGWATAGDALPLLAGWAEYILVMVPEACDRIPLEHQHKIRNFDIGPDVWSNPYNRDLLAILEKKVDEFFSRAESER